MIGVRAGEVPVDLGFRWGPRARFERATYCLGGRFIVGSQLRLSWSVAVCLVPGIRSVSLVSAEFGHAKGTGVGPRRPGPRRRWVMRHQAAVSSVSAAPAVPPDLGKRLEVVFFGDPISCVSAALAAPRLQIGLPGVRGSPALVQGRSCRVRVGR